jgi:hypothetical protein
MFWARKLAVRVQHTPCTLLQFSASVASAGELCSAPLAVTSAVTADVTAHFI